MGGSRASLFLPPRGIALFPPLNGTRELSVSPPLSLYGFPFEDSGKPPFLFPWCKNARKDPPSVLSPGDCSCFFQNTLHPSSCFSFCKEDLLLRNTSYAPFFSRSAKTIGFPAKYRRRASPALYPTSRLFHAISGLRKIFFSCLSSPRHVRE